MNNRLVPALLAVAFSAVAACAGAGSTDEPKAGADALQSEADPGLVAAGRELVVRECSRCHAIDKGKLSPLPEAPPMNGILANYNPETLVEDLIEGVRVGHDDMPVFDFSVVAADAVVAYLKSLESTRQDR